MKSYPAANEWAVSKHTPIRFLSFILSIMYFICSNLYPRSLPCPAVVSNNIITSDCLVSDINLFNWFAIRVNAGSSSSSSFLLPGCILAYSIFNWSAFVNSSNIALYDFSNFSFSVVARLIR